MHKIDKTYNLARDFHKLTSKEGFFMSFQGFKSCVLLIFLTVVLGLSNKAWAQEKKDLDIVEYFHAYEHTFRCDFSTSLLQELNDQTEAEIEINLISEINNIDYVLKHQDQVLLRSEKILLKKQLRVLKKLLRVKNRKPELQNFYENLCKGSEFALTNFAKGMGHVANVINNSVTFPIRFTYRFIKGMVTGNADVEQKRKSFYELVGKNMYRSIGFFSLYRGFKLVGMTNFYALPLFATPMADVMISKVCENKNVYNAKEVQFCENYEKVKDKFYKAVKKGEVWGANLVKKNKKQNNDETPLLEWKDEVTDDNICEFLQYLKAKKTKSDKWNQFNEIMTLMNNPGSYSKPKRFDLVMDDEKLVQVETTQMAKLRNIIVSLAPHEKVQKEIISNNDVEKYKEAMKELENKKKIFGKLYRAQNKAECQSRKDEFQFSFSEYDKMKKDLDSNKARSYMFQHGLIVKQVKQARGKWRLLDKTKLDWEIIPANTLNNLHQILRSNDVANVIVVTHSVDEYKKLVDSELNAYPTRFFTDLSKSLMSLNFYTCHSQNVLDTYDLERKFLEAKSYHKLRHLNFVEENDLFGGHGYAPIMGFKDFLISVDNDLFTSMRGNILNQSLKRHQYAENISTPMCKINVGEVVVSSGTLSVIINRRFVGTINGNDVATQFEFPCWFLDRENDNTILLQNNSLVQSLEVTQDKINVQISGTSLTKISEEHFKTREGKYSSSKILFKK
jgi:hypothetical protein